MKICIFALAVCAVVFAGCATNDGAKQIAKGAVRGASHGVIEKNISGEVGKGAAHGALNSTHQVIDANSK